MNTAHNDHGAGPHGLQPVGGGSSRTSRRRLWVGGAVGAVAVAGLALALVPGLTSSSKAAAAKKDAAPVALEFVASEVVQPKQLAMPLVIEFSGPLVAPRTAVIRAKATGTLLELKVAEGSRVKAGQLLGDIDLADLQSRVADRSASVESAQAALVEAERTHAANVGLSAQNFISSSALQSSQARLDSARAQLKSAQAQLATSRVGVKEAALVAPISGIVGKRHVVPGEKVSPEQQLLTVVDLSTLELAGTVGTHEVSLLKPGQPVQVQVEGQGKPVPGRIDRIAPAAEAGTRAIGVVVVLDNRQELFRAGQYAQAHVVLPDDAPRLTLPISAVGQASGQDFVWTLEKDALVRRIVITGRKDAASDRIEISKGLAADSQVLGARFDNLREGQPAKIVTQRTAPKAASAASAAAARS
ncbi:efflux RND transporter periplasmic adaptor subunit [Rhizobacter sp. OV335]|uniref:efflux RND transporter periplasmic adaptor subunit n=1 Tax=Rhizobacter sp. OV335 TaxID=1500264 RepID=UPI00091C82A0|nr:efflux RND transporter periplasmic adaptor subunit [Rhizobacter sp. OV335]SHN17105.1 RND family efflux transporter, MFP subunit [Rhizobacter sp. OV335]